MTIPLTDAFTRAVVGLSVQLSGTAMRKVGQKPAIGWRLFVIVMGYFQIYISKILGVSQEQCRRFQLNYQYLLHDCI